MHHGKLNLCQPISASSGSRTFVLTIAGGTSEVHDYIPYISRITSMVYSSRVICCACSGSDHVSGDNS